jgi:hypothetical protein
MTRRAAAIAVLSAAVLLGTACGDKCKSEVPKICAVPSSCPNMAAGQRVTVSFKVAPSCNQTAPECLFIPDNLAIGTIQLQAQAEACESSSSCPLPSCSNTSVTCTFTAPAPGNYQLVVFDEAGTPFNGTFQSVNGGVNDSCSI